jgi:tRNA(Arg) A34 adenosine deaminase TadA
MPTEHDSFIREVITVANNARQHGNHPFGALLVRNGEILMQGENTVLTTKDVTGHAELNLVRDASQIYDEAFLTECILYASTEPCAMCSGAIFWSGIRKVVYGCSAQRLYAITGGGGLHVTCQEILSKGMPPVEVVGPFLEAEAVQSHLTYWNRT